MWEYSRVWQPQAYWILPLIEYECCQRATFNKCGNTVHVVRHNLAFDISRGYWETIDRPEMAELRNFSNLSINFRADRFQFLRSSIRSKHFSRGRKCALSARIPPSLPRNFMHSAATNNAEMFTPLPAHLRCCERFAWINPSSDTPGHHYGLGTIFKTDPCHMHYSSARGSIEAQACLFKSCACQTHDLFAFFAFCWQIRAASRAALSQLLQNTRWTNRE